MQKLSIFLLACAATFTQVSIARASNLVDTLANRNLISGFPYNGMLVQDGGDIGSGPCAYCTDSSFNELGVEISGDNNRGFTIFVQGFGKHLGGSAKYGPFFVNEEAGIIEVPNPIDPSLPRVAVGRVSGSEFGFNDPSVRIRSDTPNFGVNVKAEGTNLSVGFHHVESGNYGRGIYFAANGTLFGSLRP